MNRRINNHPKLEIELFADNIIAFEEVLVDAEFAYLFPDARRIDTPLHEGDVFAINRDDFWDERWHGRRQIQLEENKNMNIYIDGNKLTVQSNLEYTAFIEQPSRRIDTPVWGDCKFEFECDLKPNKALDQFWEDSFKVYKDHMKTLNNGFAKSICDGGKVLVYSEKDKLLGIATNWDELREILPYNKNVQFIFIQKDGYIVGSDKKI